jgi:hypothetical protein
MVERQLKGLCYNCHDKYFMVHKCKEKNIFMAIFEDVFDEDTNVSPFKEFPQANFPISPSDPQEVEPLILLNSLIGFSTNQTFKLIVYIKNRKFIVLVDTGNTQNFIHHFFSQETMCYIH